MPINLYGYIATQSNYANICMDTFFLEVSSFFVLVFVVVFVFVCVFVIVNMCEGAVNI